MNETIRRGLRYALFAVSTFTATLAFAITNVEVTPTGPRASETTIRLFDTQNQPVAPAPGTTNRYTNLTSGTYTAQVVVGGTAVGPRQTLQLGDGNVVLRPDSTTGAIATSGPVTSGPAPWAPATGPYPYSLSAYVGYANPEVPQIGVGTLIPSGAGSERDAVTSEDRLRSVLAKVKWQSPWGDIDVEYVDGDDTATSQEAVGGANIGFVYYQPSSTGSLGLNTGPTGGTFKVTTDVEAFNLRYVLPYKLWSSANDPTRMVDLRPSILYGRTRTTYSGWAQNLSFPDIYSETHQRVEEDRYGAGLRGNAMQRLSDMIVGRVVIDVDLLYRDADLDSTQRNVCAATGCTPAQTFTATNHDGDRGWTFALGIAGGIDFAVNPQLTLGIEAGYRFLDKTAALRNPTRTINLDAPPHLTTQSVDMWTIGGTIRYRF